MQEINYQIFDKTSGLPLPEFSDDRVRHLAHRFNKSYSEIFNEMKKEISNEGVKYVIPREELNIVPMLNASMCEGSPIQYDTYDEALRELEFKKHNA